MAKEFIVYSKTKAEFEALVASGEVDTSQMGIIAETGEMWWNGEYRPLAETVPFANDLTGRIEATPEEFTFRPSAGDKSIRDESAIIKKIKGNSLVWNQRSIIYGSATEGESNGIQKTIEGDYFVFNGTATAAAVFTIFEVYNWTSGHKYMVNPITNYSNGTWGTFALYPDNNYVTTRNFTGVPYITAATTTLSRIVLTFTVWSGQTISNIRVKKFCPVIDLTQMFGAGNEPTTVEEFKALFPNDYYEYNSGELVSMTANGLETNGFNLFNGVYAEVLPNNTYYLGGTYTTIGFTEEIGGTLEDITVPTDKLYTSAKRGYIYATGTNININLSHTGVRNGEYEPYWDATKDLSIIQKYFPNGMRSAGSIYDEISFDEATQKWVAIQRVDSVDLGSLNWTKLTTTQTNVYRFYSTGLQKLIKKTTSTRDVANLLCIKYDTTYADNTYAANKGVSLNQNGTILIFEPSITSEDGASSFKTAMSGVMLYYELAEPIITTIEEVIDLSYKVGDFGTEKMLSDAFSAPFKADIIYQFNAVDRVRENSSNISKLTKKHASLTNDIEDINTEISLVGEDIAALDDKIVIVSNEVGTVKTTANSAVTKAEAAASRANYAQASADNALAYAQEEIEKTNAEVDDAQEDILDLKGLIGEEYSIWFEPDGQENTVPTLDNYPASDWATDDDYSAHDRDLYYSISLGRAWRFNYNEGSPFWEDITDSYTITALNKAQQALDKAQAAVDAVNGLQYIVSSFPEDNVLNTSAVILGKLVTVKDENSNVVAGLYGGGNEELNNSGYSDDEHGALMVFAGASSASTVAEADYRVYEDGTTYMNKGIFSGLSKYKTITINNLNVNEYFPISTITADTSDNTTVTQRKLSVNSISAITTFSSGFTGANIAIHLPAIYNYTLYDSLDTFTKETLREMVGNTFYIYNYSSSFIYLCGYLYDPTENVFSGPVCRADGIIDKGEFAKVTCVLDIDASGREVVYWQYKVGRHSMIELSPIT